jgi:hypothetical protein
MVLRQGSAGQRHGGIRRGWRYDTAGKATRGSMRAVFKPPVAVVRKFIGTPVALFLDLSGQELVATPCRYHVSLT